jgi:cell wall-associated NlpC family hydrolase
MIRWADKYLGIPWKDGGRGRDGVDCWGFVRLVLWEEFGHAVPAYSGEYLTTEDRDDIARVVKDAQPTWEEVMAPEPGDLVLFRIIDRPCHVGVMVDTGHFLHAMEGVGPSLERLKNPRWRPRVVGFYRWARLPCTH